MNDRMRRSNICAWLETQKEEIKRMGKGNIWIICSSTFTRTDENHKPKDLEAKHIQSRMKRNPRLVKLLIKEQEIAWKHP